MGLLELPPELRNQIYQFALVDPNDQDFGKYQDHKPREPALLLTNRQIRNGAFPVFWGGNTFCFVNSIMTDLWLKRLQPHKLAALRSVLASHPDYAHIWSMQVSRGKEDLQKLGLRCKGLCEDVVKLPMRVKVEEVERGEEDQDEDEKMHDDEEESTEAQEQHEVIWIALPDIDSYEAADGFVVRKAIEE
ncbi:hypothetical protein CLAFUW4_12560 [Fulvia fulva]|uniref:Uncharacterized protein n=1 Tax=Passalora fulva TaxID=5499 RepID=A0A9Q8USS6_PASFU|nr:uncharacterized protein CLAFUR5_11585 [Fulvia fulva]KAK4617454.1 hypothetical protein CLAFUR4_12565 [Fulvia fulva]KAK4618403.1 hypothetical protein CLAFUR0_12576 [Fulvia fulva]UJO21101.1 hypothetical protein CLAFUR5_11585 [Fulvia fulva]WPV18105.1 hypothetical protein CLAFUW4_12560 [Fulvia fulva]WPV33333.1 hypothetical protein CLAFUW7_12567 [Fulvia fulva]